ncbi:putative mitogen-activated protein kinase-binding protein 1 [Erysiphe necator]|uniref:Putative mitogen-activated protein kinase-binding protein 1 n=1 Tax=Uncinula necator TaxID=52586 RepID=A0A0B1PB72_UNCNE|nr:putative mitogen-activated protein kinase-binding protein 1 [Erysiphe necator]
MSSTPLSRSNTGNLKLTPNTSQCLRGIRSPNKLRSLYESGLSLKKVIGTTVSSPTAFDALPSSRIFAYTAGATVVVVNTKDDTKFVQRYFIARPTPILPNTASLSPATSTVILCDSKSRILGGTGRENTTYSCISPYAIQDSVDLTTPKPWTTRDRIKSITCLALSFDGNLLAAGETGYAPRVLIFSLNNESPDSPLIIINEHSNGIRAVAFSPDSKYLATLGNTNDGFLYIWSINQKTNTAKFHSSNKCTSFIKRMLWMGDNKIITVGTRHIKIWRLTDEQRSVSPTKQRRKSDAISITISSQLSPKTLAGRNVLLGPLVDVTFTALAKISDNRALVSSEKGDLCLIDDTYGPKLLNLTNTGFSITCIAVDLKTRRVRVGGKNGRKLSIGLDDLLSPNTPPTSPIPMEELSASASTNICAMGFCGRRLVTIDTNHLIEISKLDSYDPDPTIQSTYFSSHSNAVLGLCMIDDNPLNADFMTWSPSGTIKFWDLNGFSKGSLNVELQQNLGENEAPNECLIVRVSKGAEYLVYGDRYGIIRLVKFLSQELLFEMRAHFSDINDIDLCETSTYTLLATCGRDRTVQLFQCISKSWHLVQTLDEHSASVTGIIIAKDCEFLISSSTDRTVHIRQITRRKDGNTEDFVVLPLKIITLKASPVSITLFSVDSVCNIIVSLLDRTISTYEIPTGRLVGSFKTSDNDFNEAGALDSLATGVPYLNSGKSTILVGASCIEKAVRVYDGKTGALIDKEWGHSTNITDLALHERLDCDEITVISTGFDGIIMMWSLSPKQPISTDCGTTGSCIDISSTAKETPPSSRMPLRRVMSKAELSEIQKKSHNSLPARAVSPPKLIKRKSSRYGSLSQVPSQVPMTTLPTKPLSSLSEKISKTRHRYRTRSRSPFPSPKSSSTRRSSLISIDSKGGKSNSTDIKEYGSLNIATEQVCRTLRAYRRKLLSSDSIDDSSLKELVMELRLTTVALGEKYQKSHIMSETMLTGLLDQYSERLISLFDEKLQLSRLASNNQTQEEPRVLNITETSVSPGSTDSLV